MIRRRNFLKASLLGAGTIAAGTSFAKELSQSEALPKKNITNYIPTHEGISLDEVKKKEDFIKKYIQNMDESFITFKYNGTQSSVFLKSWTLKKEQRRLDASRNEYTLKWTDPKSALELKCVAVDYIAYPTVEWTLYFNNTGKSDTPILEKINALDISITRPEEKAVDYRYDKSGATEFVLNHNTGDLCREYSFEPHKTRLEPNRSMHFAPIGGRSSNGTMPYFNLQWGADEGLIYSIGWPGQWSSDVQRDEKLNCHITAGQETTYFKLLPGESVRTPLITLQFYKGSFNHSQNIWRRWMVEHNLARSKGKVLEPFSATCMGFDENEIDEKKHIDNYIKQNSGLDYWWMDAGWYPWGAKPEGWEILATGTWRPDPKRFPNGLRPVTDHAHSKGLKYILWFEPERVSPGSDLYTKSEYLLKIQPGKVVYRNEQNMREQLWVDNEAKRNQIRGGDALYNLGNDAARKSLTDSISKTIGDYNLDIYRHDFNISPLEFWKQADAPDRMGISENKYVCGLLQFWDDLLKKHPNIYIDTCASGGRRVDLETLRRAYPLLNSDFQCDSLGNQSHFYGLAPWIPYFGTGLNTINLYNGRTGMGPCFGLGHQATADGKDNWDLYYQLMGEWRQIADYYCGDYYPLTSYSLSNDSWIGWQYHRPDLNEGFIQLFRREDSSFTKGRFKINGLHENDSYSIINLDQKDKTTRIKGKDLMMTGLDIEILKSPGSVILLYKKG
jgi:alpha-galactosidase